LNLRNKGYTARCILACVLAIGVLLDCAYPPLAAHARPFARVIVAEDGSPLSAFADSNGIWRYPVTPDQVSPAYLEALLGYEDRWFWYHPGVNPLSMLRAVGQYLQSNRIVSGGSTLTMQVARILEPMPKRDFSHKICQILRAFQLELHFSKREILTMYLNLAPFGGTIEGVQAASYTYFGKSANRLSDAEAALLAVLPQAPTRYRPDIHPQVARAARDKVLRRMGELRLWSAERVEGALIEVVAAQKFSSPSLARIFSNRLAQAHAEQALIQSTVNVHLQQGLEDLTRAYIQRLPERTSAAVLVVDNRTQAVKAYLGSADFFANSRFGQLDMVQAIRSPGSTLKPFLYAMAIDAGLVHSESLLTDAPTAFADYRPQNFSTGYSGPVSLADALRRSLNIPAVQVLDHLGVDSFTARLKNTGADLVFAKGAGPSLAVILGGLGSNLESLVQLYTALGSLGQAQGLRMTTTDIVQPSRYLMSPGAAWVIKRILQGDHSAQRDNASAHSERFTDIAWKTGTSYGYRDSWALGVLGDFTLGVWVGRPDGTPLLGASGTLTAAPLLFSVAAQVKSLFPAMQAADPQPANVQQVEICWPLGGARVNTAEGLCHERRNAYVLDGVVPPTLADRSDTLWGTLQVKFFTDPISGLRVDDACANGRGQVKNVALWPQSLEPWISDEQKRSRAIPGYHPSCSRPPMLYKGSLTIDSLYNGIHLVSPSGSRALPSVTLKASNAQGLCHWFINGRLIEAAPNEAALVYRFEKAGGFQIIVTDEQGKSAMVNGWVDAN